ncbi:MAG: hypothetical protein LBB15_00370 [Puniceicoccales bacterium]|jgi:hypothetical protein|nr:hypothetical protein [Puniceicoccales bacterium]
MVNTIMKVKNQQDSLASIEILGDANSPKLSCKGRKFTQKEEVPSEFSSDNPQNMSSVRVRDRNKSSLDSLSCKSLTGRIDSHRANGNCLFFALYEALGKDEKLGTDRDSGITVRNLKQHIANSQVSQIKRMCEFGISHNSLTAIVQNMWGRIDDSVGTSGSMYGIIDNGICAEIISKYNAEASKNGRIDPSNGEVKKVICRIAELVGMCKDDCFYMGTHHLPNVAQILNRPILLIDADSVSVEPNKNNGEEREVHFPGQVSSFTLYNPDETTKVYFINEQGKIYDKTTDILPVFPKGTVVIAKNPGHFYGQPSFEQNNLHVKLGDTEKPVRNFEDLGIMFESDASDVAGVAQDSEDASIKTLPRLLSLVLLLMSAMAMRSKLNPIKNPTFFVSMFGIA